MQRALRHHGLKGLLRASASFCARDEALKSIPASLREGKTLSPSRVEGVSDGWLSALISTRMPSVRKVRKPSRQRSLIFPRKNGQG